FAKRGASRRYIISVFTSSGLAAAVTTEAILLHPVTSGQLSHALLVASPDSGLQPGGWVRADSSLYL
ncbi:MAG: hypothetical protein RBR81_12830, partial [Bacteroidales bacterium]|nr:hypothetical protein [Bacteroidales bacterium]